MEPWWTTLFKVLAGVVVGFGLSQFADWIKTSRRKKAHWGALAAEADHCRRLCDTYITDNVLAPLYRLPAQAYERALPALIADGAVGKADLTLLIEFFSEVATLNRGLERASNASEDTRQLEASRNMIKAKRIRDELYPRVAEVLSRHVLQ